MPFSFHRRTPSGDHTKRKMGWRLIGDKTSEEVDLEQRGDINALQRYRFVLHWNKYRTRPPSSSRKLLFVEEDLREVVQEEISIKEGLDALSKDAKEKLDALNVKYRLLEQLWWHHRSCLEDGFQLRGFQLWRSHPKWYMHRVLVEDCAGRQGCCARECGCCLNRKTTRTLGVGHCTVECGCCRRARGFDFSEEDKRLLKERCREEITNITRHRLTRVAIWGLVGGSYDSPFDLIDAPPSYDAKDKAVAKKDKTG